jgi:hypothetical protein
LVYANAKSQNELIDQIKTASPGAVVIESNDWSSEIDGRAMKTRIPDVYRFLKREFGYEIVVGNYIVLQKTAPPDGRNISKQLNE